MAMFHFRLKLDKKTNGTKVSAVKHVEYINREGSFAHDEQWKQNNRFVGNFITTIQTPNALDGFNALLYKSKDFGSIKNTARGLAVTGNASLTTISIALILADETMEHKPLVIDGSPDFHNKVMEAALKANLPISQSKMQPKSDFACQHCSNALWFIQNQAELTCFCKLMSLMVWTNSQKKVISMCDGIFQQNEPD